MGITRIDEAFRSFAEDTTTSEKLPKVETVDEKVVMPTATVVMPHPLRTAPKQPQECPPCQSTDKINEMSEMLNELRQTVKAQNDTTVLTVAIIVVALLINAGFVWYCCTG